jgi:pyridoxal 5'-phosphate synthase pdxT subunit
MADPVVGVLALQGDVREHARMLTACGARARLIRRPVELDSIDALVVPGGESTTMSKLAVDFGVLEPIRDRIKTGMPVYGSCAGMIMLADEVLDGRPDQQTFGGIDMTVRRNAFGRQVDSVEAPVEIDGVGEYHAVFIRAPWVERVGAGVRVLGRITEGGVAAKIVAVRQEHLLATAFHPELTGDARMHRFFVTLVVKDKQGQPITSEQKRFGLPYEQILRGPIPEPLVKGGTTKRIRFDLKLPSGAVPATVEALLTYTLIPEPAPVLKDRYLASLKTDEERDMALKLIREYTLPRVLTFRTKAL